MAVYFVTDEVIESRDDGVLYSAEAKEKRVVSYRKFVISYDGLGMKEYDGEPIFDDSFSGEVTLDYGYTLPEEPKDTDSFRIRLSDFSVAAWITIGDRVFDCGMTPMYVTVPGTLMHKDGILHVTVANTAANEILQKNDLILSYPKAELGYHSRILEFEKRRPPLKIGNVVIEKVR